MAITFESEKILFDNKYGTANEIEWFLPVHLTIGAKENNLYKKDGSHNEQYYKWQFLYCFVSAGLCSKDFIGVEVSFPKGNKNSASIKLDAAIFDNKDWFEHYNALHTKKDDSKWDDLNWLKDHLICGIEFKKEGWVFGVGCKVFTIAGPVILYGIVTSFLCGLVYWGLKVMGVV